MPKWEYKLRRRLKRNHGIPIYMDRGCVFNHKFPFLAVRYKNTRYIPQIARTQLVLGFLASKHQSKSELEYPAASNSSIHLYVSIRSLAPRRYRVPFFFSFTVHLDMITLTSLTISNKRDNVDRVQVCAYFWVLHEFSFITSPCNFRSLELENPEKFNQSIHPYVSIRFWVPGRYPVTFFFTFLVQ